jgi:hypothetical protein
MLDQLTGITRYLELMMQAMLIACFFQWGFSRRYRWFLAYILAELVRSVALFGVDNHSPFYAGAWTYTQPVFWVLQMGAVLELMLLVYHTRPAVGKFARQLFVYYIPSAMLVCLLVQLAETSHRAWGGWQIVTAITVTKWLSWLLLFMLVAQEVLYLSDAQPIEHDVVLHRRLLVVYVGITPGLGAILAYCGSMRTGDIANLGAEISWVLCLAAWIVCFRRLKEQRRLRLAEELG